MLGRESSIWILYKYESYRRAFVFFRICFEQIPKEKMKKKNIIKSTKLSIRLYYNTFLKKICAKFEKEVKKWILNFD
jgi:hypothetical protein